MIRRTVGRTLAGLREAGGVAPLASIAGAWFLALGMRLVFPAVLPYVRADLGIGNATAGLLVTLLWVAYALTQFPAGILSDRIEERRVLVASMLGGAVAVAVIGATSDLAGVLVGLLLYGVGTGLFATPRVMVVSDVYARRATTALGVVFASGNVGNTALPALLGVAAGVLGWRVGFLASAPLFVLSAVSLHLSVPATTGPSRNDAGSSVGADDPDGRDGPDDRDDPDCPDDPDARDGPDGVGRVLVAAMAELRRQPVQYATVALVLFAFAYQGLVGFLPAYLVDAKGLSPGLASVLFGAFFASGLVAQLAAGTLADAYGRRPLLVASLVAAVTGVVALTLVDGLPGVVALVVLLGLQLGFWPVVNAYAYDVLSGDARGGVFGFVRTVYLCLGAAGPVVVGALFDTGRYDAALLVLAAVFGLVIVVCTSLPSVHEARR